jgi:hypothetical protein
MMNIQQFMQSAIQSTEQVLYDKYSIDIQLVQNTVTKINDQKLYGLRVVADAGVPTPAIHLNNSFELYKKGFPFDRLVQQISMMLLQAMQQMPPAGEALPYCESMDKRALSIRVLETARNQEYLKEHPYMELGNGFSAICDRMKSDGVGGFWRSAVTHEMVQADHLDAADLLSCALHNAARIDPPVMMSMEKVIALAKAGIHSSTVGIHAVPGAQSYILTNKSQGYGASALFYPGTAKTIADKLCESYYALPSSLHEFIIIPRSKLKADVAHLKQTVLSGNRDTVTAEEILSDSVLYFDKDTAALQTVA